MNSPALTLKAAPSACVDRASLYNAIDRATTIVERKVTWPILSNLRLQADCDTLFITATDMDIELVIAVPAVAHAGLDVTIPANTLKEVVKAAPKSTGSVTIHQPMLVGVTKPNGASAIEFDAPALVDCGKVNHKLHALNPDGFPTITTQFNGNATYRFDMPTSDFLGALNSVSSAISTEKTRYYLNGIYLHTVETATGVFELRAVATDGHRMWQQKLEAPMGAAGMPGIIIPRKTVALLQKLLKAKSAPETVAITTTGVHFRIAFGDVTITSKLIEGTFPNYERVTPKNNKKLVSFAIADMQEAIKAVSVISSNKSGKAVKFTAGDGEIVLTACNPDHGESAMAISANCSFEDEFEIGFNAAYVTDMMAELAKAGGTANVAFNDSGSPALFTGAKTGLLGVLMPMRV